MDECAVPGCPALATPGETKCKWHQVAVQAGAIGVGRRAGSTRGGEPCGKCHRLIKADEWVWREPIRRQDGWRRFVHVSCPAPTLRVRRDARKAERKPLLAVE